MDDKLIRRTSDGTWLIFCQGCGCCHGFDSRWTFNGNEQAPTLTPSHIHDGPNGRCHIHVTDGKIIFLPDCGHSLAGQTLPLEMF